MIRTYILSCIKICKIGIIVIIGAVLTVLVQSCFNHDNHGYPSAVYFTAEGGMKMLYGNTPISHLEILHVRSGECLAGTNYNDLDTATLEYSSISAVYEWVEVKQDYNSTQLQVTVAPLGENESRRVRVVGYYMNEYAEIEIVQKAK